MIIREQTSIRIKDYNDAYNIVNNGYVTTINKEHQIFFIVENIFNSTGRVYGNLVDVGKIGVRMGYKYLF